MPGGPGVTGNARGAEVGVRGIDAGERVGHRGRSVVQARGLKDSLRLPIQRTRLRGVARVAQLGVLGVVRQVEQGIGLVGRGVGVLHRHVARVAHLQGLVIRLHCTQEVGHRMAARRVLQRVAEVVLRHRVLAGVVHQRHEAEHLLERLHGERLAHARPFVGGRDREVGDRQVVVQDRELARPGLFGEHAQGTVVMRDRLLDRRPVRSAKRLRHEAQVHVEFGHLFGQPMGGQVGASGLETVARRFECGGTAIGKGLVGSALAGTNACGQQRERGWNQRQCPLVQRHRIVQLAWRARLDLQTASDLHQHLGPFLGRGVAVLGQGQGRLDLGVGHGEAVSTIRPARLGPRACLHLCPCWAVWPVAGIFLRTTPRASATGSRTSTRCAPDEN
mmetsp:Transcript_96469/g.268204  ORF Transcript_96469/g.268204 Transcript_96469/m.268204 type:complete len:390 (-) Transcript_96469:882-2051(-)